LEGEDSPCGNSYGEQKASPDILLVSEIPGTGDVMANSE
jgi:hypothetical protein